jgi:hypothetical protein
MRNARSPHRGRRLTPSPALLAPGILATAVLATAALSVAAGHSVPVVSAATITAIQDKTTAPKPPGWRVITTIGPYNQNVAGTLTASSARDAWSVWTGTRFTAVERLTGTKWTRVPLPAELTAYARSAVAFGGDSASDFWLFGSQRSTEALRFTGTKWTLAPIPSWVLRHRSGGGGLTVRTAVLGPGNVWVFSLGAGNYAAHYNGHAWAKVQLPATPDEVSTVGADDIWALAGSTALHWNGRTWTTSKIPAAAGKPPESFGRLSATGPRSAWVLRTISSSGPRKSAEVLHWNGTRWRAVAGAPADIIDSMVPDGSGGLWATGLDINPGGFSNLYHLANGRWTTVSPPEGVFSQAQENLTWIPDTRSLWGTAAGFTSKGNYGVLIKYGPLASSTAPERAQGAPCRLD